jgi:isoprenylcysteine carboxyl methyltransferase (ICMT) family protein YpbQ
MMMNANYEAPLMKCEQHLIFECKNEIINGSVKQRVIFASTSLLFLKFRVEMLLYVLKTYGTFWTSSILQIKLPNYIKRVSKP